MDAIECLKTRRSIRSYQDKPVAKEIIEDIVDCGRLAATARNVQPWQFIAVTDQGMREQLAGITEYGKFLKDTPVCIGVFCEDTKYYLEDGSAATQNILNAACAHGLGSCWIAGDKKPYADDIRRLLDLPDGYRLICLIAVGYPAQMGNPEKKPLSDVLHWEKYEG